MAIADEVKNKVQRLLANKLGSIQIDKDGDFVFQHESAVVFIRVRQWADSHTVVTCNCPMLYEVPITADLCRWVAVQGQEFLFGSVSLTPLPDGKSGWLHFRHSLLGDDIDESELMNAVFVTASTANDLDNDLQEKFGGKLFGPDK